MKWYDFILAPAQWLVLAFIELLLFVLGLVVIPLALPFRTVHVDTAAPFIDNPGNGNWMLVTLPRWAWIWSNDRDGALGDRRGWWDANAQFKGGCWSVLNMWWWLAIRNPTNNTRFLKFMSVDMTTPGLTATYIGDAYVRDKVGFGGWQFVKVEAGWSTWYGLYFVHEYKSWAKHGLVVRMGFKVNPGDVLEDWSADPQVASIGATYRVNPFKSI